MICGGLNSNSNEVAMRGEMLWMVVCADTAELQCLVRVTVRQGQQCHKWCNVDKI